MFEAKSLFVFDNLFLISKRFQKEKISYLAKKADLLYQISTNVGAKPCVCPYVGKIIIIIHTNIRNKDELTSPFLRKFNKCR